jgi:dihydroflavonol-4-reductase
MMNDEFDAQAFRRLAGLSIAREYPLESTAPIHHSAFIIWRPMSFLVTGATGLLGNNIVRLLLARGAAVRVLARQSSDPRPLEGLPIEIAQGDVRDADSVRRACQGISTVIHSAAFVHIGWTRRAEAEAINVGGTENVARAVRDAAARLVHISSIDALAIGSRAAPADEETPLNASVPCPYVDTKRAAEVVVQQLVADGLQAVIVNPGYMIGPWDWKPSSGRMLLQVARGWAFVAPPGVNSFCDPRDVADAILTAAERGAVGRRYALAGENLTYFEAWRIFARVAGARAPWFTPPGPLTMYVAGRFGDLKTKLTGREGDINSAGVALARMPRYYSSARAERELGYRRRNLEESARDAWAWFQEHGYVRR